jgi:hypothetical protein
MVIHKEIVLQILTLQQILLEDVINLLTSLGSPTESPEKPIPKELTDGISYIKALFMELRAQLESSGSFEDALAISKKIRDANQVSN